MMKWREMLALGAAAILIFLIVLFFGRAESEQIMIARLSPEHLPVNAQVFVDELKETGSSDIHAFQITSPDSAVIATVFQKRMYEKNQTSTYQEFLTFPVDQYISEMLHSQLLLLFYQQETADDTAVLCTMLTSMKYPSVGQTLSCDLDKRFGLFLPTFSTESQGVALLGYLLFTDNEGLVRQARKNPMILAEQATTEDYVYEIKVTAVKQAASE